MFESMKPHLIELRKRLAISVFSVLVGFVIAFSFHNTILGWITDPLRNALTQVGKKIESANSATWQIGHHDKSGPGSKKTDSKKGSSSNLKKEAAYLHDSLDKAAKEIEKKGSDKDKLIASYLHEAAKHASRLALYADKLSTEGNKSTKYAHEIGRKSYEGMITTHQVGGAFFVALKVSFFAGILMAIPMILLQLWLFIAPGLYDNEKRMVLPFVVGGSLMFALGVLFAYYIVTPFGFQFLITFGSFLYTPLINIEDYVGFFTKIMIGFGLAFELPVFTYFLGALGLITDRTLKDFFKYAIVIIFLVAAFLTPPDVLTQLLMAGPLILLYGLSILIVRLVNPETVEEENSEEDGSVENEDESQ